MAWSGAGDCARLGGFFRYSRQQNPLGMAAFAFVARDLLRLTESFPVPVPYWRSCASTMRSLRDSATAATSC